ncbi:MAG: caspase family protein [Hyphomicrobiaceae bacterium]
MVARRTVVVVLALLAAVAQGATPAFAGKRLALIVGIADYDKKSGLQDLKSPRHDAAALKDVLEKLPERFEVTVATDTDIRSKADFDRVLATFVSSIQPGDEVLFYFSGHGNTTTGKGNLFLLPDARSEASFIKNLSNDEARELDSVEKKAKRYHDWLSDVAIVEADVEKAIAARKPKVIVIIADACRIIVKGTKGASIEVSGVRLPQHTARGTYRLYSASAGQYSLDSSEPISTTASAVAGAASKSRSSRRSRRSNDEDEEDDDEDDKAARKGSKEPTNSLFTKILVNELAVPGLEFSIMAAKVRVAVKSHADKLARIQIPDFSFDPESGEYYFVSPGASSGLSEVCRGADLELERLRQAIAAGSIGRQQILDKQYELARCGPRVADQIEILLAMEAQGASALTTGEGAAVRFDPNDPAQACEANASSPFDPNRSRLFNGDILRKTSLATISGELDRTRALDALNAIRGACENALQARPKVARYSFLTGRVYQTLATVSKGLEKQAALAAASAYFQQATDLGYPAAFNELALLYKQGEYYRVQNGRAERRPVDRSKAAELFERGAGLNHVVALYNLGMAYKTGDLGIAVTDQNNLDSAERRHALAFRYLSQAAERGFVPALIQSALLLHDGKGVPANPVRAIELLEIAASRGSFEAMYWIGEIYRRGAVRVRDPQRAIVWHARAAESGDARSQETLAEMLTEGTGLPAPQREAAGRYWRLAADAGRPNAQIKLADLLRQSVIPFRPVVDGAPDGGALEIRTLYVSAFVRGNPRAGLELARLFRTGFPKDRPAKAIPKDPSIAVRLLWETIEKVRQADPASVAADPKSAALAAFELMDIHKEASSGGAPQHLITEDQIRQLRSDYGDGTVQHWIRASALGEVNCGKLDISASSWVLVWNWQRKEPPTDQQLDWIERRFDCKGEVEKLARESNRKVPKDDDIGFTRKLRNRIATQQRDALKDFEKNGAKAKSFVDRMIALATTGSTSNRRR